jgi:hypothetical protein
MVMMIEGDSNVTPHQALSNFRGPRCQTRGAARWRLVVGFDIILGRANG